MFKIVFRYVFFTFFLIFSFVFFACSESNVQISSVDYTVVFDFSENNSSPTQRLSVFVSVISDEKRSDSLKLINSSNGYEWLVQRENLEFFESSGVKKIGYSSFASRPNELFAQGKYNVILTDRNENEDSFDFLVSYDESFSKKISSDFPLALGDFAKGCIALYSKDSDLLYYGNRKSAWKTNELIFSEFDEAQFFRVCYVNKNESVMCIMPPVQKN